MKKFFIFLAILLFQFGNTQTTNVTYKTSTLNFPNPERGFYKHTSAHSGTYQLLNQSSLTNYRVTSGITLIYRAFPLDDYINSPIADGYLANMQKDFNAIRNAGLKCIIRFTYSDDQDATPRDASKATILSHLQQLKPLLQANEDVISVMQAGFIGAWGEWYYTSQAEFGGYGYNQTNLTATNIANRKEVVEAILSALPKSRMIQIRTPTFKQGLYSKSALTNTQAFSESSLARIGHHNDCFLASSSDFGTYDNVTTQYPYLEQDTKFVPMGGETCALNSPRTDCTTAVAEMTKFHWSFLNIDYYPAVIDGFETDNCFETVQKSLGYRFELTSATFPQAVNLGTTLPVTINLKNSGFSSPFNERNTYLVLKNTTTNQVFPILMNVDVRKLLGTSELTIKEDLQLPTNLTTGNYKMYLHMPDLSSTLAKKPEYAIRFANENVWDSTTGYNDLNYTLNVVNGTTLGTSNHSKLNMTIYPVPANDEIAIELQNIQDYNVAVINSIGQKVKVSNILEKDKMIIDTNSLSNGLYFIEFTKDSFSDVRKIIVKH